jgi:hypothetical protein
VRPDGARQQLAAVRPRRDVGPCERRVLRIHLDAEDPRAGVAHGEVGDRQADVRAEVPDQAIGGPRGLGRTVIAAEERLPDDLRVARAGTQDDGPAAERAQPHALRRALERRRIVVEQAQEHPQGAHVGGDPRDVRRPPQGAQRNAFSAK